MIPVQLLSNVHVTERKIWYPLNENSQDEIVELDSKPTETSKSTIQKQREGRGALLVLFLQQLFVDFVEVRIVMH